LRLTGHLTNVLNSAVPVNGLKHSGRMGIPRCGTAQATASMAAE
jgi:hypothetical protein